MTPWWNSPSFNPIEDDLDILMADATALLGVLTRLCSALQDELNPRLQSTRVQVALLHAQSLLGVINKRDFPKSSPKGGQSEGG